MTYETMRLFFSLLALATNVAVIGGLVLIVGARWSTGLAEARDQVLDSVRGYELWLAFTVALVSTLGSLYLSEIAHLEPCRLCWYQRIAMYPLVPLLGIAAWRRDRGIGLYTYVIAGTGAIIAAYHYLIQQFPSLDSGACSAGVPCSAPYIWEFGFVSIPYMALSGFTMILLLVAVSASGFLPEKASSEEQPITAG